MKMFQVAWCGPSSSLGALGARVVKVGTAIGPTGRHTGRCAFFMAFSTRLINEGILHLSYMLKTHLKASPYRPKIALTVWFASGFTSKGHFWQVAAQFEQQLFNRLIIHIREGVD